MLDKRIMLVAGVCIVIITLSLYWTLTPSTTPWTDTGRLTLLVRPTPGISEETTFGFGIDDIELYSTDGTVERVTLLNRRVRLQPGSDELILLLDTNVPIGSYSGLGFTMKSLEVRNSWEQDIAPLYVTAVSETIRLDVSYQVEKDVTSSVLLAFETTRAIHEKEGEHFFLPIIQIETRRGATVENRAQKVIVSGGNIEHSATFGMDWTGVMRFNYRERKVSPPEIDPATEDIIEQVAETASSTQSISTDERATSTATSTDTRSTTTNTLDLEYTQATTTQ